MERRRRSLPNRHAVPSKPFAPSPIALAVLCLPLAARAALGPPDIDTEPLKLRPSRLLRVDDPHPAMALSAQRLETVFDRSSRAEGDAELRYGDTLLRSDRITYDQETDLARAEGNVRITRGGNVFSGPSAELRVGSFTGELVDPLYFFSQTGGGGRAKRISFSDAKHVLAEQGTYSSCTPADGQQPDWVLSASSIAMDFDANEGVAKDAVLHFLGVPLLAAPSLSFPINGERKSGWLPPEIGLDNRSGFQFGVPYYWNIAPNRDATVEPFILTRRGPGVDGEFRYLEPDHSGRLMLDLVPHDDVARRSRWNAIVQQSGRFGDGWQYHVDGERVSDDDYWKDMPQRIESKTERLYEAEADVQRNVDLAWGQWQSYARVEQWQALQGTDPTVQFVAPYQRTPQIGMRLTSKADDAVIDGWLPEGPRTRLEGAVEVEYNRFDLSPDALPTQSQLTGQRLHLLGHVSLPMGGTAWWVVPRVSVNAARYALDQADADGRTSLGRTIPSFSIDSGLVLERDTTLLGRAMRQTLEPRLLYVHTPYRDQGAMPNFDSAPKDFNYDSIYSDDQFSGVDRINDANQLTFGAVSRWLDASHGDEALRLGVAQRMQFSAQRLTPDGTPQTSRFSDLLLIAGAHLSEQWWADGTLDYNPQTGQSERAVYRARYSPGPFRTVSVAYRLARGQSEQAEVAWQWPLWGATTAKGTPRRSGGSGCAGAWYSAGRMQYSLMDRRMTDSVFAVEYDAGCWVMRVGVERLSTGTTENNTRLMVQLELVGLSELGSNALHVLKDNIPGYRQLSADRSASQANQ